MSNEQVTCEQYLVITNVAKRNNVKFLINTAVGYNFQIILVGWKNFDDLYINTDTIVIRLETMQHLEVFLSAKNIPLVGIEIIDGAKSVLEDPFTRSIAIMPGNEGDGLSKTQKRMCESFVYIPQYGHGTASLNVYIATTIIMHRYSLWAAAAGGGATAAL